MITKDVMILNPATGEVVGVCRGPNASGACPRAGADGVVPCAGFLISPAKADPQHWPLPVPPGYRHCDVLWNERAGAGLQQAERCREQWKAGLDREARRTTALARARDPRYRRMTPRQLRETARWRWRVSPAAQALRRSEQRYENQANMYLAFVEFRRNAAGRPAG